MTFGNGPLSSRVETVYQYDDVEQRLTGIDTHTPFGQIQKLRYGYTAHGLVARVTNDVGTGATQGPTSVTFEYDQLEQLVQSNGLFTHDDGSQRRFSLEMRYDISGRTQQMNQQDELLPSGGGAPTPIAATSRNVLYAYAMGRRHQAESIGTTSYQYDRNGNQLQETRASGDPRYFEWDEEDRLLAVRDGAKTTAEFRYDAGGTRTHKTSASSTTVYPSAFVTVRNGTEVTRHIYAAGERVSAVFSDAAGERVYWSHGDAQGSAHYTTNASGAVHEHAEHLPFGEGWVQQSSGTDVGSHRFHGHQLDGETGLHYVGARYYDPRTTRWLSADPALPEYVAGDGVGDPRNLVTYGYVFNSPGNYVDPTGRQAVPTAGRIVQPAPPMLPDGGTIPRPDSGWPAQLPDGGAGGVTTLPGQRYPSVAGTQSGSNQSIPQQGATSGVYSEQDRGMRIIASPNAAPMNLEGLERIGGANEHQHPGLAIQLEGAIPAGYQVRTVQFIREEHRLSVGGREVRGYLPTGALVHVAGPGGLTQNRRIIPHGPDSCDVDNGPSRITIPVPTDAMGRAPSLISGVMVATAQDGPLQSTEVFNARGQYFNMAGLRPNTVRIDLFFVTYVVLVRTDQLLVPNASATIVGAVDWSASAQIRRGQRGVALFPQVLRSIRMSTIASPLSILPAHQSQMNRAFPGRIQFNSR